MAAPLRGTRALQLTLALIKPDAVAHPLILEVRTNPEPLNTPWALLPRQELQGHSGSIAILCYS